MNNSIHVLLVASITLIIQGCDTGVGQDTPTYLAMAGKSYITQYDLDHHLGTFDDGARSEIINNPLAIQRLVESIAMSEIMADRQEANLSDVDRLALEASVAAFRRQKLSAAYIADNLSIKSPSLQEMRDYYDNHIELFGGTTLYTVDVYSFSSVCSFPNTLFTSHDVAEISSKLKETDCGSSKKFVGVKLENLQREIGSLPRALEVDKGIWMSTSVGQSYVFCNSVDVGGVKPFTEVIPKLRENLATAYLKDALAGERKKLNKEIEFFD